MTLPNPFDTSGNVCCDQSYRTCLAEARRLKLEGKPELSQSLKKWLHNPVKHAAPEGLDIGTCCNCQAASEVQDSSPELEPSPYSDLPPATPEVYEDPELDGHPQWGGDI